MANKKKTTQEIIDRIVKLKRDGYTQRQIGRMIGIHHATVGKVLRGEPTQITILDKPDDEAINRKVSSIPQEIWDEWERVTSELRRYIKHDTEG